MAQIIIRTKINTVRLSNETFDEDLFGLIRTNPYKKTTMVIGGPMIRTDYYPLSIRVTL